MQNNHVFEWIYVPIRSLVNAIRLWHFEEVLQLILVGNIIYLVLSDIINLHWHNLILFILHIHVVFSYMMLVNNISDFDIDRASGKSHLEFFSIKFYKILAVVLGVMSVGLSFLYFNKYILIFSIIFLILGTSYSIKPFRLKERGIAGLFAGSVVERSPILTFFILDPVNITIALYLFGWIVLLGFSQVIAHMLFDYHNDKSSSTNTYLTHKGIKHGVDFIHIGILVLIVYLLIPVFYLYPYGILLSTILFAFSSRGLGAIAHVLHLRKDNVDF